MAEVIVSQPDVAAAIMRTRTRAVLQGMTSGDTNIFFLDDAGRTIQVLDLRVIEQPSQVGNALQDALRRVIPNSNIKVESVTLTGSTNRVVLSGSVNSGRRPRPRHCRRDQFAGGPENVASILDVAGAQQVMLQVTVSEIRRDVARDSASTSRAPSSSARSIWASTAPRPPSPTASAAASPWATCSSMPRSRR